MPDFIDPVWQCVRRELPPANAENVPHVECVPVNFDEWINNQAGLMQGCGENRAIPGSLESKAAVAADCKPDGTVCGHGFSSDYAGRITVNQIAAANHIHGKNAMFIEAPELSEFDDRMPGHRNEVAEIFLHFDKSDVAQVFPVAAVQEARGKVDSYKIVEDDYLGSLRELGAAIWQFEFRRIKNFSELSPFHQLCLAINSIMKSDCSLDRPG